jgi:copper transport protein
MLLRLAAVWLFLALGCVAASAHATLVRSDPADGAVLATAPEHVVLVFNEPVSPLVLRLVGGNGEAVALDDVTAAGETVTVGLPAGLGDGGHVVSWRVVSGDGHPIGGSVVFSVGTAAATPIVAGTAESGLDLRAAIAATRALIYVGLFVGIGGLFFAAFVAAPPAAALRTMAFALAIAPVALLLSVSLQGLDALGLPLAEIARAESWRAGFATSYGTAALVAVLAALPALVGLGTKGVVRRGLAIVALVALGTAFALTGHASAAPPQWLTRPAVFIHTTGVALWTGALVPLAFLILSANAQGSVAALRRFSRLIPCVVAPLVASGLVLAVVQVGTPEALVTTGYGIVLLVKGLLLIVLFALAALNRMWLTQPSLAGDAIAARRLAASVAAEIVIVAAILAVVALWRFTPPPRSLAAVAAAPDASAHLHSDKGSAMLTVTPGRSGPVSVTVAFAGQDGAALAPIEVTLTLSMPSAGIEPIRRPMTRAGDAWRADGITLPVPGPWTVRAAALISDYDLLSLEGEVAIAP